MVLCLRLIDVRLTSWIVQILLLNDVTTAAGGTVDITAHEVLRRGKIKEIYRAVGGAAGGADVNQNFVDALREAFGGAVVDQ